MAIANGSLAIGKLTFATDNNVTACHTTKTHTLLGNNNRTSNRK